MSRYEICRSIGEECQEESELAKLLDAKHIGVRFYDGFEPSGRMHIAQGILKTINVNKCIEIGGTFIFWIADWFALMNDKMGGSLSQIRKVGNYFIDVWKATGMITDERVQFIWSSDEINARANEYWPLMLDIASRFTISRIMKCCKIMGRNEDTLTCAQIIYPLMQCTDIFFLDIDICQLGLDQRKVNMLAREYAQLSKRKSKPIILSHHMMMGLLEGQDKMSKSDPNSAIFMEDSREDIERKIRQAWCPIDAANIKKNPLLDYLRTLVYHMPGKEMIIGDKVYKTIDDIEAGLSSGNIQPDHLRSAVIDLLDSMLVPVRKQITPIDISHHNDIGEVTPVVLDKDTILIPILPIRAPSLDNMLHILATIRSNKKTIVLLQDWSAKLYRDINDVLSIYAKYVPEASIVLQSKLILSDPNAYWISVINKGRSIKLWDMIKIDRTKIKEEPCNQVIAALMLMVDIETIRAGTVILYDKKFSSIISSIGASISYVDTLIPTLLLPCKDSDFMGTKTKIFKCYCPPNTVEGNIIIDLARLIIQYVGHDTIRIHRREQDDVCIMTIDELIHRYEEIHPADLKMSVQNALYDIHSKMME